MCSLLLKDLSFNFYFSMYLCTFSMMASTLSYSFQLVGAGASCLLLGPPGSNWCLSFAPGFSKVIRRPGISIVGQLTISVES